MKLDEIYSVHSMPKKKSNNLLKLFVLVAFVILISFSLARYTGMSEINFLVNIAKFNVSINDKSITDNSTNISKIIDLKVDENYTDDGLIKCGQKGHFDIKIDPKDTEVSLKYQILFNTETLPEKFFLTGYSINDNSIIPFSNGTVIYDTLELMGRENFDSTDIKNYRIYQQ